MSNSTSPNVFVALILRLKTSNVEILNHIRGITATLHKVTVHKNNGE